MEIPALYLKYKTVMAYKAAAKRMRQVLDIRDPLPLSAALGETQDHGADEIQCRASGGRGTGNGERGKMSREGNVAQGAREAMDEADEPSGGERRAMDGQTGTGGGARKAVGEAGDPGSGKQRVMDEADELEALRARAVCAEVLAGIGEGHGMTTALLRRLGELTDPERVEDANMLAGWKERYRLKITVRTKSSWERRLRWTG